MKKETILLIILSALLLMGCNKTPSTTVINNTPKETIQQEIDETIDVENLPQISLHEEEINETLELEGVTLTINGIVSKPDTTEGLYTYFSEFRNFEEYLPKMEFLFGEYQDRMYLDGVGSFHYRVDVPENEYWADLLAMPDDGYVMYCRAPVPVSEEEVAVNLTNEEAISMANDILADIGVPEVELYSCIYKKEVLQITPDGELSGALGDRLKVEYYQNLQGVPVMTTLIGKRVNTRVVFWSRGLFEARISVSDYKPCYGIEKCILFEEALEIFKEYVSKNEDFNGVNINKFNINKVLFEYTVKKEYIDGKFVEVAVPCWHFYREVPDGYSGVDLIIDAITGAATRY